VNRICDCPPIHKSRTYYPHLFIIQEASIPLECRLMKAWPLHDPALEAALIGMAGLATAMGIGRFAFTPMLPLMQLHDLVSLRQGSYLASANYVGYLLGALLLFAFNPPPARAVKFGLATVAASTLAMAFTSSFSPWLVLRLIAGVASAFVLVGVSGWALTVLAAYDRAGWRGWVFAGVGGGILFAGAAVLAIGATDLAPVLRYLLCRRPFSRSSSQRYAWAAHSW